MPSILKIWWSADDERGQTSRTRHSQKKTWQQSASTNKPDAAIVLTSNDAPPFASADSNRGEPGDRGGEWLPGASIAGTFVAFGLPHRGHADARSLTGPPQSPQVRSAIEIHLFASRRTPAPRIEL